MILKLPLNKRLLSRVRSRIVPEIVVDLVNDTRTLRRTALAATRDGNLQLAADTWQQYLAASVRGQNTAAVSGALKHLAAAEVQLNADPDFEDANRLDNLWSFADENLSKKPHAVLQRAFLNQAKTQMQAEDNFDDLARLFAPICDRNPDDPRVGRRAFRLVQMKVMDAHPDWQAALMQWYDLIADIAQHFDKKTVNFYSKQIRDIAVSQMEEGRLQVAKDISTPMVRLFPQDPRALSHMALIAEAEKDWTTAANYWQLSAAVSTPIRTTNHMIVATNPKEGARLAKYALKGLRGARFKLAQELHAQGQDRAFCETVTRAVEQLPDHRLLKKDPDILRTVSTYVQQALLAGDPEILTPKARKKKPKRIAFCVDVLKVSDRYTHSKILYAMCRNLMLLDPDIETHIIVTHERLTVSTPTLSPSFNLTRGDDIKDMARAALPEFYGSRFHMHFNMNFGLEGLVKTCRDILELDLDVIIYGGGHTGIRSNESRLVRHCLFDHIATAFFFIQANNEVDAAFDMIIARGPHAILGAPDDAPVRIQPYPTITKETAAIDLEYDREKARSGIIISAVAGVRMDLRLQAMSEDELNALFSVLDDNPGSVWHFIGAENPKAIAKNIPQIKSRMNSGQVVLHKLLPFTAFAEMASNAALYLQLPGFAGGAGGAGIARRSGVPILTFRDSDISGRQPEETIFSEDDVVGFSRKASGLLADHDEWERIARAQISHSQYLCETAAQGFYDCLSVAYDKASPRVSASSTAPDPKTTGHRS